MTTFITTNDDGKTILTPQGALMIIMAGLIMGFSLAKCSEYMLKRRPRLRAE